MVLQYDLKGTLSFAKTPFANGFWKKTLQVKHVSGKINPAHIFTKETRNGAHFHRLRDSFMSCPSAFLNDSTLAIHHASQHYSPNTVALGLLICPLLFFFLL
jgi:hypothetical protein